MGCFVTWGEGSRASRPCGLIGEGMLANGLSTPVSFTGGTPVLPSCAIEGLLKIVEFVGLRHLMRDGFTNYLSPFSPCPPWLIIRFAWQCRVAGGGDAFGAEGDHVLGEGFDFAR